MDDLKLLITDDVEDNRLVLQAICRKMKGFAIREAQDGLEAVEITESWRPDIILMDIMMPRMDGFEASRIIKERWPETIIIAVTAVIDPQMEANMSSVGVSAYIRKPIDKEAIRFKLESFASLLRSREGEHKVLSSKEALNPFNTDIRHFRTVFDVSDAEGMMDFGVWALFRMDGMGSSAKADTAVELFYEIMRRNEGAGTFEIVVEESFEELYATMTFDHSVALPTRSRSLASELDGDCIVSEGQISIRLRLGAQGRREERKASVAAAEKTIPVAPEPRDLSIAPAVSQEASPPQREEVEEPLLKEVKTIDSQGQELLRQSFAQKTSAAEYIQEIGGDVLEEIHDLASLETEWKESLELIEGEPSVLHIHSFTETVLGAYVHAINNLFEFTALAYALASLGGELREHAQKMVDDPAILKKTLIMLEHLGSDLNSWRDHLFVSQSALDIHYLDSSFFSSCMQIEGIITDKHVTSHDGDDEIEFF